MTSTCSFNALMSAYPLKSFQRCPSSLILFFANGLFLSSQCCSLIRIGSNILYDVAVLVNVRARHPRRMHANADSGRAHARSAHGRKATCHGRYMNPALLSCDEKSCQDWPRRARSSTSYVEVSAHHDTARGATWNVLDVAQAVTNRSVAAGAHA